MEEAVSKTAEASGKQQAEAAAGSQTPTANSSQQPTAVRGLFSAVAVVVTVASVAEMGAAFQS